MSGSGSGRDDVWRALSSPVRRRLLDELRVEPRTTGDLAAAVPDLSRFAVMQHLGVLEEAGLVVVRRRGRYRYNHLNPVPLREWYERWVVPLADRSAAELLALKRHVERSPMPREGEPGVSAEGNQVRTVSIEAEMRFRASPERVFKAIAEESPIWFKATYGEERVKAVVMEPFVGGRHFEDWGDGRGWLYGHVTVWDPPRRLYLRGRVDLGVQIDTRYAFEAEGDQTILQVTKVAVGPMTDEEAQGIEEFGNRKRFEAALRELVEAA